MTGLEKIINEILDEAAREADAVVDKAKAEADTLTEKARTEAKAEGEKIAATAQQTVAELESSRTSSIALQRRQRTLQMKQELLDETLELARQELCKLPEEQYFALLAKQAAQYAETGEGKMLLNAEDKARLPAAFAGQLAAALPEGCSIAIAGETCPIDGGFVLKYGDVEQNCSFSALFDAKREDFTDMIRDTLFA